MLCEMCSQGKIAFKVDVEGSRLSVCEKCARFGKVVGKLEQQAPARKDSPKAAAKATETVQVIKSDYAVQIKRARERLGLTQEELARKLLEKESFLHKVESGHLKPDLALARKLERFLKIELVEQVELSPGDSKSDKGPGGLTIGDLINIK